MENKNHTAEHHIIPLKTYLGVGAILFFLTAVTIWVAQVNLGGWNAVVAVSIAVIKATFVALIYMHLKYDNKIYSVIFLTALVFLAIFIALTMFDIANRGNVNESTDKPINKNARIYDNLVIPDSLSVKPDSLLEGNADSVSINNGEEH
ncbi:MAG: cytochrome C oxidase subunit IV family protein [bacterium]